MGCRDLGGWPLEERRRGDHHGAAPAQALHGPEVMEVRGLGWRQQSAAALWCPRARASYVFGQLPAVSGCGLSFAMLCRFAALVWRAVGSFAGGWHRNVGNASGIASRSTANSRWAFC